MTKADVHIDPEEDCPFCRGRRAGQNGDPANGNPFDRDITDTTAYKDMSPCELWQLGHSLGKREA